MSDLMSNKYIMFWLWDILTREWELITLIQVDSLNSKQIIKPRQLINSIKKTRSNFTIFQFSNI